MVTQIEPDPAPAARGRFITFEGGEGTGKSTQMAYLQQRLLSCGVTVVATREPGGTPFGEAARKILLDPATAPKSALAQMLLFYSARADHLESVIRPALQAGHWVLCDRFSDSTRAYQGAAAGVSAATVADVDACVVGDWQPDLTLLLDLDPRVGLMRAQQRRAATAPGPFIAADTFEGQQIEFHNRLREGFLAIAASEPERVHVVDGHRNELTIADELWTYIAHRFALEAA
jgi:dTMP kinase